MAAAPGAICGTCGHEQRDHPAFDRVSCERCQPHEAEHEFTVRNRTEAAGPKRPVVAALLQVIPLLAWGVGAVIVAVVWLVDRELAASAGGRDSLLGWAMVPFLIAGSGWGYFYLGRTGRRFAMCYLGYWGVLFGSIAVTAVVGRSLGSLVLGITMAAYLVLCGADAWRLARTDQRMGQVSRAH